VMERLARKIQRAAEAVPAPVIQPAPTPTRLGLITIGSCHAACIEALEALADEGIVLDYLRVRGFPFADSVRQFVEAHDTVFVVEQNRDAQLRSLLMIETGAPRDRFVSVTHYSGFPLSAQHVTAAVRARLERHA